MSAPIQVRGLGKRYRVGAQFEESPSLRATIMRGITAPFRNLSELRKLGRGTVERDRMMWALRNITFDVEPGEVLGIVGRNGAGKSTLLKILSRVTFPTEGEAELRGQIGSLLEVGTGFHPELTGRENIFLSGSILGMDRAYIRRSFDEIVAFAGIEKFIDTPIKRYSSGMYVRLAFAVAAHLPSDVLLVDEVLAVGDAEFQKKCMGKMSDVAKEGRTLLFVSHNLASVERLCTRTLVLDHGGVQFMGETGQGIRHYLRSIEREAVNLRDHTDRTGSGEIRIVGVEFRDAEGHAIPVAPSGSDLEIWIHFEAATARSFRNLTAGFSILSHFEVPLVLMHSRLTGDSFGEIPTQGAFVCRVPRLSLPPSDYRIGLWIQEGHELLDRIEDADRLQVVSGDFYGTGRLPPSSRATVLVDGQWRLERVRVGD